MAEKVTGGYHSVHRCRLCTANDPDGVIEHVAEQLWESRRHGTLDDRPWADAWPYWQTIYRELAATAVESLSRRD